MQIMRDYGDGSNCVCEWSGIAQLSKFLAEYDFTLSYIRRARISRVAAVGLREEMTTVIHEVVWSSSAVTTFWNRCVVSSELI